MSGLLLLERLSEVDLAVLAEAAGEPGPPTERAARLRAEPDRVGALIEHPRVFDALFRTGREADLVFASPFLAFSVLLSRVVQELADASFVREWVGPRQWVPVFDVEDVRAFAEDRLRRLFLADLLTSYTHVASGSVWVKTTRGWSRRRFSELDPVHLAQLIEAAPEHERLPLYRRLGDLTLFLAGVFPDHAGGRLLGPGRLGRVKRVLRADAGDRATEEAPPDELTGTIGLLEWVGRRSYRLASRAAHGPKVGMARVVEEVAERFPVARRVLNYLTERYLFPVRDRWFPSS